ncbi:MAG TPA: hypothetical protein VMX14_06575, partial [Anaerolineae bacterium]|nr:hypothetical protein [Anaerolineae bacterium]
SKGCGKTPPTGENALSLNLWPCQRRQCLADAALQGTDRETPSDCIRAGLYSTRWGNFEWLT